jgi:tetratricopeptide (TPR) repeat protein
MGARRAQALAWCLLGESLLLRGRWDEAEDALRRSLDLHRDVGARAGEALTWQRLGELAAYRGDAATADECVRRGLELGAKASMASHLMRRLYATAVLNALEQGDASSALGFLQEAAEAAESYGDCPTCSALLHPVAAETYARVGDPERAEDHAQQAEQVAGHWESGAWKAMAEAARGAAARAHGQPASQRFLAAAATFDHLDQPFEAARCRLLAGADLAQHGEVKEARALFEQAEAGFRDLGATRAEQQVRRERARLAA